MSDKPLTLPEVEQEMLLSVKKESWMYRRLLQLRDTMQREAELRAQVAKWEEGLIQYGRHEKLCAVVGGYDGRDCDCGLNALLADTKGE